MSTQHTKYSDRMFFDAVCCTAAREENAGTRQALAELTDRRRALPRPGLWDTAKASRPNREALTYLAGLLRQNPSPAVLHTIRADFDREVYRDTRCKIVFLLQEYSIWPAVEHFYRAAAADPRFEAQAVYVPFFHENATGEDHNIEIYRAAGIPVRRYDEYDLSAENPEVVVFTKPYNSIPKQFYIAEVEKIVPHTIYVPYGLELNMRLIRYGFQDYTHYSVWRHLAYGEIVKTFGRQYGYRDGDNIVVWGHPRVDSYHLQNTAVINETWREKIAGRRTILWCPHHTIVPGPECVSTWLDNKDAVFSFFEKHRDAVLLWRPHPLLFGALVSNGCMTQTELDTFLAEKQSQDNIILDQTPDYRTAFTMSDALITDGSTFSIEYLLTGKPLMITTNSLEDFYEPEELEKALSIGRVHEDIHAFLEQILSGADPLREKRLAYAGRLFYRPADKTVSENILDHILADIETEIQMSIQRAIGA